MELHCQLTGLIVRAKSSFSYTYSTLFLVYIKKYIVYMFMFISLFSLFDSLSLWQTIEAAFELILC